MKIVALYKQQIIMPHRPTTVTHKEPLEEDFRPKSLGALNVSYLSHPVDLPQKMNFNHRTKLSAENFSTFRRNQNPATTVRTRNFMLF